MNAMELDIMVPSFRAVEVKSGDYSAADLNDVAWLALKDVKKSGTVTLEIKNDVILPKAIQRFISGWPFGNYHFDFTGELEKSGYIDISFYFGGLYFPCSLQELRVFELNGWSCKDITINVDVKRRIITGRTDKLSNYVIMIPEDPNDSSCLKCKAVH
jgi:hypothetical protein